MVGASPDFAVPGPTGLGNFVRTLMRRFPLTLFALALIAGGFYVLRNALGCFAGTITGECHVFFGITLNGGFMVAIGAWLLWKEFVRP